MYYQRSQLAKDITRLLVARTDKMPTSDLATRACIYTAVAGLDWRGSNHGFEFLNIKLAPPA